MSGDATPEGWWSPLMTWLLVHTSGQVVAGLGMRYFPRSLAIAMALSALFFPYSIITGTPVAQKQPLDREWLMICMKWVLVVLFVGVPMLFSKALHVGPKVLYRMAIYMTICLALNLLWTLPYSGFRKALGVAHGISALMLILAVLIQGVTLVRRGEPLAESSSDGWLRFRSTTASWVMAYHVWHIGFVAPLSIHHIFQDIACPIHMAIAYYSSADRSEDIGFEFGFCKAVSLGVYISIDMFRQFVNVNLVLPQHDVYWMLLFVAYLSAFASASILARGFRDMWMSFATMPAALGSGKNENGEHA